MPWILLGIKRHRNVHYHYYYYWLCGCPCGDLAFVVRPIPVFGQQHHKHFSHYLRQVVAGVLALCVAVASGYEEGRKLFSSEGSPVPFGLDVPHWRRAAYVGIASSCKWAPADIQSHRKSTCCLAFGWCLLQLGYIHCLEGEWRWGRMEVKGKTLTSCLPSARKLTVTSCLSWCPSSRWCQCGQ